MIRLDYNKIMFVVAVLLLIFFGVLVIKYYINWYNMTIFCNLLLTRIIQLLLPSIFFFYLYNQNTKVKITCYDVENKKIPKDFNEYKIAHISDFHNTNSKRIKTALVKKLEQNKPDIIVITGDLIDSRRTNIDTAKEFIQRIKHIAPIYYVLGNHESRLANIIELESKIKNAGTIILRNEKITLKKNNETINLIGLDDPAFYTSCENFNEMKKRINEKLKDIATDKYKYTILLIHRPEYIETYSKNNVDLVFTGHAHGGQIRIPLIGGIIAPGQGLFPRYTRGIYEMNGTNTVISRGIGNSKFPFRINNRPELIFVTLKV